MYKPTLIDLSHEVEHGMITYPGLPAPIIGDFRSHEASREHYEEGTTFHIGKLEMVTNTGTYLDSPFHRYPEGKDISELDLSALANLEGLVVSAPSRVIGPEYFEGLDLEGRAVLVHTGWDRHWGSENYFEGHPYLTGEAAEFLNFQGVALVGIDSLNIDDTSGDGRPVHSILLDSGIPIVEHLCNLASLPAMSFTFFAVPVKVKGLGSFPVRAFAMVKPLLGP